MASGVKIGRTAVGTGENVGSAVGVAVGVNVGVWVGKAVWVRAMPVCTMAMAVFCTSVVGGAGAQAVNVTTSNAANSVFFMKSPCWFVAVVGSVTPTNEIVFTPYEFVTCPNGQLLDS